MYSIDVAKMIDDEDIRLVLNKYSFGEICSSIERIYDGWTNLTYKFQIDSNKKNYILREYLSSTQRKIIINDIQFELDFISYLYNQYHLPVVPMINPPGIFLRNNGNYAVIFPFIDGIKYIDTINNPQRKLWQTIEISRFLGRLHSIESPMNLSLFNRRTINIVDVKYQLIFSCQTFENIRPDLYKRIRRILDQYTDRIPLIDNEYEQIQFEKYFEENLPKGLIHIDIHDENVLFHLNEKQIIGILDFDDMSIGPYLLDIAMTLCFWSSIGTIFQIDYAKEFLYQYQSIRKQSLTNNEWNLLDLYCYMTMFHQILFTIQSRDQHLDTADQMIEQLLSPIEAIANDQSFIEKLR